MAEEKACCGKVVYKKMTDDVEIAELNDTKVLINNKPADSEIPKGTKVRIEPKTATSRKPVDTKVQVDVFAGHFRNTQNDDPAIQTQPSTSSLQTLCENILLLIIFTCVLTFIILVITLCVHVLTMDTLHQAYRIISMGIKARQHRA